MLSSQSRVVFVSTAELVGGAEEVLIHLLANQKSPTPVRVISSPNSSLACRLKTLDSVEYIEIASLKALQKSTGPFRLLKHLWRTWLAARAMRAHLDEVARVISIGPGAMPAIALAQRARELRQPHLTLWVHTVITSRLTLWILSRLPMRYDIVCVSQVAAQPLAQALRTRRGLKISVEYNPVLAPGVCAEHKSESSNGQKPWMILHAGRITQDKGIGILIDALLQIPRHKIEGRAEFWVAGQAWTETDEAYFKWIKTRAQPLSETGVIRWLGQVDLLHVWPEADAFAFTSLLEEACPTVLQVAMARRLPVVSSDIAAAREILAQSFKKIFYFSKDSAQELKGAFEALLDSLDRDDVTGSIPREVPRVMRSLENQERLSEIFFKRVSEQAL